eukprot:704780-Ditylum_brightwellii.AAC.1
MPILNEVSISIDFETLLFVWAEHYSQVPSASKVAGQLFHYFSVGGAWVLNKSCTLVCCIGNVWVCALFKVVGLANDRAVMKTLVKGRG